MLTTVFAVTGIYLLTSLATLSVYIKWRTIEKDLQEILDHHHNICQMCEKPWCTQPEPGETRTDQIHREAVQHFMECTP